MSTPTEGHHQEVQAAIYLSQCFPEIQTFYKYGGWASSACMITDIVGDIFKSDFKTVIECGSGLTTLYIAAMMKRLGRGRVYALEHAPEYKALTERMLAANGVAEYAEVIWAPLAPQNVLNQAIEWYDASALPEDARINADMVVIDGPPQNSGPLARLGAITLIETTKTPPCVYIDDHHTDKTQAVLTLWREHKFKIQTIFPTPELKDHAKLIIERG